MITAIHYTVQPGDNLYDIAQMEYGNGYFWPDICNANRDKINDCNLIYSGQDLSIPGRHRAEISSDSENENDDSYVPQHSMGYLARHDNGTIHGNLGCSGLESLWISNGGSSQTAFVAAEIAMAESGGQQYSVGPVGEKGYWQINPNAWPTIATFDPNGNARAAIAISNNGSDWSPWTTYTSGAYIGQC